MNQTGSQLVKRFTENMYGHFLPQRPLLFSLFYRGWVLSENFVFEG